MEEAEFVAAVEQMVQQRRESRVLKQILAAVKGKLTGFEIPKKVALIADTFTPENDMLTSAFKLKRKPIADQHRAVLNKLYGKK